MTVHAGLREGLDYEHGYITSTFNLFNGIPGFGEVTCPRILEGYRLGRTDSLSLSCGEGCRRGWGPVGRCRCGCEFDRRRPEPDAQS
jgi:hypothetical protein